MQSNGGTRVQATLTASTAWLLRSPQGPSQDAHAISLSALSPSQSAADIPEKNSVHAPLNRQSAAAKVLVQTRAALEPAQSDRPPPPFVDITVAGGARQKARRGTAVFLPTPPDERLVLQLQGSSLFQLDAKEPPLALAEEDEDDIYGSSNASDSDALAARPQFTQTFAPLAGIAKSRPAAPQPRGASVPAHPQDQLDDETPDLRPYRDRLFAVAFRVTILAWFVVGTSFLLVEVPLPSDASLLPSAYSALRGSAGHLAVLLTAAATVAVGWVAALQAHPRAVMLGSLALGPIVCACVLGVVLWHVIHDATAGSSLLWAESIGMAISAGMGMAVLGVTVASLWSQRKQLSVVVRIVEMACDVLRCNPLVFVFCLAILGVYLLFAAVWLVFFSQALLAGTAESQPPMAVAWVLNADAYVLVLFFLAVLAWTTQVLQKLQQLTISAVVADWYFHRHDPFWIPRDSTSVAVRLALTRSFGTACFAGLCGATASGIRLGLATVRRTARLGQKAVAQFAPERTLGIPLQAAAAAAGAVSTGATSTAAGAAASLATAAGVSAAAAGSATAASPILTALGIRGFASVADLADTVCHLAVVYAGVSGQGLYTSAVAVTGLASRNFSTSRAGSQLLGLLLTTTAATVSLTMAISAYFCCTSPATGGHESPYAYIVAIVTGTLVFSLLRFVTSIVLCTLEATFVCYLLDLDHKEMNALRVHQTFGHFY